MPTIQVNREQRVLPPIQDVLITLNEEEARHLTRFLGTLSRSKMQEMMSFDAEETYQVTSSLYWMLSDALLS